MMQIIVVLGLLFCGMAGAAIAYREGRQAANLEWSLATEKLLADAKEKADKDRREYEADQKSRLALKAKEVDDARRDRDTALETASKRDKPADVVPVDAAWWLRKRESARPSPR